MRKIVLHAEIVTGAEAPVTLEHVRKHLASLGSVSFSLLESVDLASGKDPSLTKTYWVYVSSDETQPYLLVSAAGEVEGDVMPDALVKELQQEGVCTEFHAAYANGSKYGTPPYACDSGAAEAAASEHFIVASEGLAVHCRDRGDDGGEDIWLKVMGKAK